MSDASGGGGGTFPVRLREARPEDAAILHEWRNDTATRSGSLRPERVTWHDHLTWLDATIADPNRRLFIGELRGAAIGQVRVDRVAHGWEVSLAVAPDARGRRHAGALLRALEHEVSGPFIAFVKPTNAASIRTFTSAGYRYVSDEQRDGQTVQRWQKP
jgi:RimJ/RimL family protein N-acetyltransferase